MRAQEIDACVSFDAMVRGVCARFERDTRSSDVPNIRVERESTSVDYQMLRLTFNSQPPSLDILIDVRIGILF